MAPNLPGPEEGTPERTCVRQTLESTLRLPEIALYETPLILGGVTLMSVLRAGQLLPFTSGECEES